jgi:predicted PurR-regulated permease PerM
MNAPASVDRLLRTAVVLAIIGMSCLLVFLLSGFAAWSVGLGIFLGVPLLVVALVLYVMVVIRDLRRRGAL